MSKKNPQKTHNSSDDGVVYVSSMIREFEAKARALMANPNNV